MLEQVLKVSKLLNMSVEETEAVSREVLKYLYDSPWDQKPPQMGRDIYQRIYDKAENPDPYKEIKSLYNREIMALTDDLEKIINQSQDSFTAALKLAISGNLIDFGSNHRFSKETLLQNIDSIEHKPLVVDDSRKLRKRLASSKDLLYLGDNCGEIVFDKIFIEYLLKEFPDLIIRYGVRGGPIINDVTRFDAAETGLDKIVEIIDNGNNCPGTILSETSEEFRRIFYEADTVISKGQGNYESLNDVDRQDVYLLFMAKCEPVASSLGVETMSLICVEK